MRALTSMLSVLLLGLLAACGSSDDSSADVACELPDPAGGSTAVTESGVPAWYDNAKFGIMIHWGVWTVPAWAETSLDPERVADPDDPLYLLAPGGVENFMRHNPYTEWYENSLAIEGTATQAYHRETFGADFDYREFQAPFESRSSGWRADEWADLFDRAHARYVVLVSKHHDGYTLWPSAVENPARSGWFSPRDVVGELTSAVRERCMRMGLYYSGGIDWSFAGPPIENAVEFLLSVPAGQVYADYFEAQYRELIELHRPAVLWNDISAPELANLGNLFDDYRAAVPDGVVNDRWGFGPIELPPHFRSVEYDVSDGIADDKWEAVQGIGKTFGFNRNQPLEDYGTAEQYIHLLVDVVSKNGNLLLNVGPMDDGTIPTQQVEILRALGDWLDLYGEAIFDTRPWSRFAGTTNQGIGVRFTRSLDRETVYAVLLGSPAGASIALLDFPETPASVRLLASDEELAWRRSGTGVVIELPSVLPEHPAHALAISLE